MSVLFSRTQSIFQPVQRLSFHQILSNSHPLATRLGSAPIRSTDVHPQPQPLYKEARMSNSTARRDDLLEQSSYEQLKAEHEELEQRLHLLGRPRSMSPEEQSEIQRIKKRKLAIKDRMRSLQT